MIKFVIDESVDKPIAEALAKLGFEIYYVAENFPSISDEKVLDLANSRKALLITADKDFGELIFRKRLISKGIVLVRLPGIKPKIKAEIVSKILKEHIQEIPGAFSVISESGLRIRKGQVKTF